MFFLPLTFEAFQIEDLIFSNSRVVPLCSSPLKETHPIRIHDLPRDLLCQNVRDSHNAKSLEL